MESYVDTKSPLQCKRYQRFVHTQRTGGYAHRGVVFRASKSPGVLDPA